jgi:8-oxo-dGTP pyrophosphatase MutT (NUDIX family)
MTKKACLVFEAPPPHFVPKVEVAGCYCDFKGKVLILKRHPQRPQGGSWGLPAGKLEQGESPSDGVLRELFEETGLGLKPEDVQFLGSLYVRHPDLDFIFHIFYKHFNSLPEVILGLEEHLEARWVTIEEALALPLISGGGEVLYYVLRKIKEKI